MDKLYPIVSLGETAENVAERMQITRVDQDKFALESQRRAVDAINAGRFRDEIVPVEARRRRETVTVDTDEHPRYTKANGSYELATSLEDLAEDINTAFMLAGADDVTVSFAADRLTMTSQYSFTVLGTSTNADLLGLTTVAAGYDVAHQCVPEADSTVGLVADEVFDALVIADGEITSGITSGTVTLDITIDRDGTPGSGSVVPSPSVVIVRLNAPRTKVD